MITKGEKHWEFLILCLKNTLQWIETVREQCATHIKNVNDASAGVVFSRAKIVSVRKQLEDLSKGIEDNVQRHNEKVTVSMIAEGHRVIGKVKLIFCPIF